MAGLIKSASSELYTAVLGGTNHGHADAVVALGGKSLTKFVPNINASKWDDEFFLNINNKNVVVGSEKQTIANNKIDLVSGNNCHRYYIDANGHLEYEIIFSSRPASAEILLDLKFSKGLEFYYQPALTDDEIARGCVPPDNVVGSYAVYCNKANNKYQTGKVCHIYRPFLIDAKGNVSWCTLFIDPSAGVIQILMDAAWLAAANYPVILDPTFGYASAGAYSDYWYANYNTAQRFPTGSDAAGASLDSISIYGRAHSETGDRVKLCIWSAGDGYPLLQNGVGAIVTSVYGSWNWLTGDYTNKPTLAASTDYYLGFVDETTALYFAFDYATDTDLIYGSPNNFTTPVAMVITGANSSRVMSIYGTYTVSGGGSLGFPIIQNYYRNMRS